jgi:hypothetical protein
MTIKTILNKIKNDKILSILVLFSVILVGTLIYYNINVNLLHQTEGFYVTDINMLGLDMSRVNCKLIEDANNTSNSLEIIKFTGEDGNSTNVYIVDKDIRFSNISKIALDIFEKYVDDLNKYFTFVKRLLLKNRNYESIREILFENIFKNIIPDNSLIKDYKFFEIKDIHEHIKSELESNSTRTQIKDIIDKYENEQPKNTNTQAIAPEYPDDLYITSLYKVILETLLRVQLKVASLKKNYWLDETKKAIYWTYKGEWQYPYFKIAFNERFPFIKSTFKKVFYLSLFINMIDNEPELFNSLLKMELLDDYTMNQNGQTWESAKMKNNENNKENNTNNTMNINKHVYRVHPAEFDLNYNEYIRSNADSVIKEIISSYNPDHYNKIYRTNNPTYYHIMEDSSIMGRYTSAEYSHCNSKNLMKQMKSME